MLGLDSYGLYTLGISVVKIASQFSILGLRNGIVKFVSLYKGIGDNRKIKGTLISAFVGATTFSLVISTLLFIFSHSISVKLFNEPDLSNVLRLFSISLPFYVLMIMASYSARAFQNMQYDVGVRNISFSTLNLILAVVFFLLGFKLLGAIYAFLLSASLSAFVGFYFINRISSTLFSSKLRPTYEFRKLLRFSAPVFLIGISYIILFQTDRIMIGYFMNSSDIGVYNAAVKVALLAGLVLDSVNAVFSPIISDLYNKNKLKELENLFKISTRWVFTLTLPVTLIMMIFSKEILGSLFGESFVEGWIILVIFSISRLITTSTGSVGFILQMTGKQDVELVNTIVTVIINIGLNIWLIQAYGILGAALGTGISMIVINIVKLIEVHKLIGMQPYNVKYVKAMLAGVLSILACLVFNNILRTGTLSWILSIVVLSITYFISLLFLGPEEEDKMLVKQTLIKIRIR